MKSPKRVLLMTQSGFELARNGMKTVEVLRIAPQPDSVCGLVEGRLRNPKSVIAKLGDCEIEIPPPFLKGESIRITYGDGSETGWVTKVKSVVLMRPHDITGPECRDSGITWVSHDFRGNLCKQRFASDWNTRHGNRDFEKSPWVWMIKF